MASLLIHPCYFFNLAGYSQNQSKEIIGLLVFLLLVWQKTKV